MKNFKNIGQLAFKVSIIVISALFSIQSFAVEPDGDEKKEKKSKKQNQELAINENASGDFEQLLHDAWKYDINYWSQQTEEEFESYTRDIEEEFIEELVENATDLETLTEEIAEPEQILEPWMYDPAFWN